MASPPETDGSTRRPGSIIPGALIDGKYRVIRVLGEGGMGKVVLARHEELEQDVAIKLLLRDHAFDRERVARLLREARATARLRSEHVVRVSDVGRIEQVSPYIVMEYLRGRDLERILAERGRLPVAEAVDYVLEALDGVAEAHATGIVHGDLKPSNLFVAQRPDGAPILKVVDFGISKELSAGEDRKLTAEQLALGTPAFMAPEQLKNAANVDARADIWSLGVVLYELLTGELPFEGKSGAEIFANVLTEPPIPLSLRLPGVPAPLDAAISKCLERDRDKRHASAADLAVALAPFGSGTRDAEVERIKVLARDPASLFVVPISAADESQSSMRAVPSPGRDAPTVTAAALRGSPSARVRYVALAFGAMALVVAVAAAISAAQRPAPPAAEAPPMPSAPALAPSPPSPTPPATASAFPAETPPPSVARPTRHPVPKPPPRQVFEPPTLRP